jgi:hypothetical protein
VKHLLYLLRGFTVVAILAAVLVFVGAFMFGFHLIVDEHRYVLGSLLATPPSLLIIYLLGAWIES